MTHYPTTGHIPRESYDSKRYMHLSVRCSTVYNSQDVEATEHPLTDEWRKMWYVYIHLDKGIVLSHKKQ